MRAQLHRSAAHVLALISWVVVAFALVGAPSAAMAAQAPALSEALTELCEVHGPTLGELPEVEAPELLAEEAEPEEEDPKQGFDDDNSAASSCAVTLWRAPARAALLLRPAPPAAQQQRTRPRLPGGARAPPLG